ncbi:unnamed protein product [Musa textilis]
MARSQQLYLFLFVVFVSLQLASADRFTVGDRQGWNPNINYTVWVEKHKPFHVGDWLVFYYQSGMADVVQVDEAGYNKCDASNPISNYSKGRNYAFPAQPHRPLLLHLQPRVLLRRHAPRHPRGAPPASFPSPVLTPQLRRSLPPLVRPPRARRLPPVRRRRRRRPLPLPPVSHGSVGDSVAPKNSVLSLSFIWGGLRQSV